jgi:hypothetical protein
MFTGCHCREVPARDTSLGQSKHHASDLGLFEKREESLPTGPGMNWARSYVMAALAGALRQLHDDDGVDLH